MKHKLTAWGTALVACMPLQAAAQGAANPAPKASPPLAYRSAFADYKPFQEVPLGNWRALNAAVAGRGLAGTGAPAAPQGAGTPPAPTGGDTRARPAAAASASHSHPGMHHKMHGGRP
ncbi:MAG: hypothetical protein HY855_05515 [Burkholderiales bacterium]|nr:hypothetical protein [Burkholderiales bacterium]